MFPGNLIDNTNVPITYIRTASAAGGVAVPSQDNHRGFVFNIPVTGIDAVTHTWQWHIDAQPCITITATGDGAGAIIAPGITLMNQTITAGANHNSTVISPIWVAEAFVHHALNVTPTQNGAASTLCGVFSQLTKATAATVLGDMPAFEVGTPVVTGTVTNYHGLLINSGATAGTVTNAYGINIANQSPAAVGGSTAYAIRIASQTANATTTRAIELMGTGVNNAIRLGSSVNLYAPAADTIRITESTNTGGLAISPTLTTVNLTTVTTNNASITLQSQVMTPGANHNAVLIGPEYTAENFSHTALTLLVTQDGANSDATGLSAIGISMVKATGATTLTNMTGLAVAAPSVTGTVTNSSAIGIRDQTNAGITNPRGIVFTNTGVANSIQFGTGTGPLIYSSAANNLSVFDSTAANGIVFNLLATAVQTIRTATATTGSISLQANTFTAGAAHNAVTVDPTWVAENFTHRGMQVLPIQNGTNSDATGLVGFSVRAVQSGAGTLTQLSQVALNTPLQGGTITNVNGILIADHSLAGGTTSYAINITSQSANAVTTLAINIAGNGVSNAIRFNGSPYQYSNVVNNIRFADSTNVNGLDFNLLATANQTINTITATTGSLLLQNQTFTPGVTHSSVQITPTWASENFLHRGLNISITQNGANTNEIRGVDIAWTKATGATTLAIGTTLNIGAPTITGTVTTVYGLQISDQSIAGSTSAFGIRIAAQTAGATTTRAIEIVGSGVSNALRFGADVNVYETAAGTVRISDSTNVGGLDLTVTTTNVTLNTVTTNNATINLMNNTYTPGVAHNAITIAPTWSAENFNHIGTSIQVAQNGANTQSLIGLNISATKNTGASTLATMIGVNFATPTITGTVTTSVAANITDQTAAGGTTLIGLNIANQTGAAGTVIAIRIAGTGGANAIQWGASALQFAGAANNIRFADSTGARGIDHNLTAAGNQTIISTAGNLILGSGTGFVQIAATTGQFYPATDAAATQTASGLFAGTGAPTNANGNNGDIYFRSDGGALTTVYQRRAGAWVGVV